MNYKYRWLYVLLAMTTIWLFGYIYDLEDKWSELTKWRKQEKSLFCTLIKIKEFAKHQHAEDAVVIATDKYPHQAQMEVLKNLLVLAHAQGVMVKSVVVTAAQQFNYADAVLYRLSAQATFPQLYTFVQALSFQAWPVLLGDFLYQQKETGQFELSVDILVIKNGVQQVAVVAAGNPQVSNVHNPFCYVGDGLLVGKNDSASLQAFPLDQIKLVGFLQQGERAQALVSLPNGVVTEIEKGTVIGIEHGVVEEITKDTTTITTPTKKHYLHLN